MRWKVALGVVVLLVGGALAYLAWTGTPPTEVAELVAQGGEKSLREPLRAPTSGPRVLVIALDGVGDGALRQVLRSGGMPHLAALLGPLAADSNLYRHAYAAPGVLSVLPSTTLAAWSALFTGRPAGDNGVPGNEWFAREEDRFYAPAPVSVEGNAHALEVYSDGLMGAVLRAPTVYEQADLRSYVSLSQLHRGADLLTVPDPTAFGDLVAAFSSGLADTEEDATQEVYQELDRTAVESLLETLRDKGVPRLQVVYFPGVDLYTHVAPRPLPGQRQYLSTVVDSAVGRLLAEYRRQQVLDSTYVLVVADHGHTPVLDDDLHALGTDGEDEPPALLRRAGFRVRPFELEPADDERDYQATVAYQGALAYVYLADRSTCPRPGQRCAWAQPPRLNEDVLPVVRALDRANRLGEGVPALRGTLDLILVRAPQAGVPLAVWDGEALVPLSRYLQANPRPELLALEERLRGLTEGPYGHHAGDVLLLARSGMHRPIQERFYFSGRYHSWHGSPTAQDSRIPLLLAHTGRSGTALRDEVHRAVGESPSQLQITPLILRLLDVAR